MNFFQKIMFRKEMKKHINRPLDINEILSRETDTNVVVDTYEFFMRQCQWNIDDRFFPCIKCFLLCVLYDGEIANGGISQFLTNSSGNHAHQTADALHIIGALDAERLLRKSFTLFDDGKVPEEENVRNRTLYEISETDTMLEQLDLESFNTDIHSYCYQYLMDNKNLFLAGM